MKRVACNFMFGKSKKKNILKINDLVKFVREAHLINANIVKEDYYLDYTRLIIEFEKFDIIDLVKINGFSEEEEHNIEIKLKDGTESITVYKSPEIFVRIDSFFGEQKVYYSSSANMKDEKVEWSHKGNWGTCITEKINTLVLEIDDAKSKLRTADINEKKSKIEEQNKMLNRFNNLFSDDK